MPLARLLSERVGGSPVSVRWGGPSGPSRSARQAGGLLLSS